MATLSKKAREFYSKTAHIGGYAYGTRNAAVPLNIAKTLDKFEVFEHVEMDAIVNNFKSIAVFYQNKNELDENVLGFYQPGDNFIVFQPGYLKRPTNSTIYAHETTHALSSAVVVQNAGKIRYEKPIRSIIENNLSDFFVVEVNDVTKEVSIKSKGVLSMTKEIVDVTAYNYSIACGVSSFIVKHDENLRGKFTQDDYSGLNEGITNLFAMLASKGQSKNDELVACYPLHTKVAAQIFAILGNSLWINFFNQNVKALAGELTYNEKDFDDVFNDRLTNITTSSENIKDSVVIQKALLKVFGEKIRREILDPQKNIYDVMDFQNAVMNCYLQYAKLFDFGYYLLPEIDDEVNKLWDAFKSEVKSAIEAMDQKICNENFKPAKKINVESFIELCKQQRLELCYFLPKDLGEVSLGDALIGKPIGQVEHVNKQLRKETKRAFFKGNY